MREFKKIGIFFIIMICYLSCVQLAEAKTVYKRSNDGNWNADDQWSTTSDGSADTTFPIAGDTVYFDDHSGDCTINVASECAVIDCNQGEGYSHTLTQNANMTTTSNITLVAGMTFTYTSGTWIYTPTSSVTINSGGKEFGNFKFSNATGSAATITLNDNMTIKGTLTWLQTLTNLTINSNTLNIKGDSVVQTSSGQLLVVGTTTFSICGNGNQSIDFRTASDNFSFNNPIDIASTGGTVTFVSGSHRFGNNFTKSSGTIDFTTNSTSVIFRNTTNRNIMSETFYNLKFGTSSSGNCTYTLDGNITVNNDLSAGSGSGTVTINSNNIYVAGAVTMFSSGASVSGTTLINVNGSGTQTLTFTPSSSSYTWSCPLTISNSGTVNFANANHYLSGNVIINGTGTYNLVGTIVYKTGTLTYTAGTVNAGTSTLSLEGSATLATNGINFYNIQFATTGTYTLSNALSVDGTLGVNTGVTATLATSDITASGSLTVTGTGIITGRTITLDGTGTWSHTSTGTVKSNLVINTAGTITVSGVVYYNTGTLSYVSGTVSTAGSTLTLTNTATLSSGAIQWNNVSTTTAGTVTLSAALHCNGNISIGASTVLTCAGFQINCGGNWSNLGTYTHANNLVVFDGTSTLSGATTFFNLTLSPGSTNHLTSTQTFTVAGTFNAIGTVGSKITLDSVTGGSRAIFPITTLGTISYVTAKDIDSSGGVTVVNDKGTDTNSINWNSSGNSIKSISVIMLMD